MTGVHSYSSHSYTSLRDVVACSFVAASNNQWSDQLSTSQSLPDIRHVHMRNPLLEKAARAYLATGSRTQRERNSSGMSTSFSSFSRLLGFLLQPLRRRLGLVQAVVHKDLKEEPSPASEEGSWMRLWRSERRLWIGVSSKNILADEVLFANGGWCWCK